MTKILVHLAEGFEEMEALIPVDIWRRAGFDVETISISKKLEVNGAHKIKVVADKLFIETNYDNADMLFLPGGMPGATNLDKHEGLRDKILALNDKDIKIGAICAAPLILGHNRLLVGKKSTCFPGFENELIGAEYTANPIETEGNIITGKGAGVTFEFALEIVKQFKGENFATELAAKMQMQ
ncbi:MAG: DJ-1/PfpI family protein [Prolixibacteraceae bacterium]|jgi:4-methyl-5(b-hydroxyethyl)-thiazole monophosphate biosynthesis|nr:DJ-1/PfpI family protein [Prolixibacteraceae bacterium]